MAIMEVTLAMTYRNQQCINRWNYISGGTPAAVSLSFALASAFGSIYDLVAVPPGYPVDTPMSYIAAIVVAGVQFQQLTVKNVYSVTDFYQTPFVHPYVGNAAGTGSSPVLAAGFRTNLVRTDVARGTKRFVGISENFLAEGGVIEETAVDEMNNLAASMSEILTYDDEGNTLTFTPAVCGKQEYDPNPDNPDANHRAYRYFPTEAEQLAKTASGVLWQAYDTARSQSSRQYGRGR